MVTTFQNQHQVKILPASGVDGRFRWRETDLDEVMRTVENVVLPRHANKDIFVTITLLEKNLKIMADMALMEEALIRLTQNALDGLPGGGNYPLCDGDVNAGIESLLDGFHLIAGACTFIGVAADVGDGITQSIRHPFPTMRMWNGQSLGLPVAYRIIRETKKGISGGHPWGKGEANMYLPLTRPEMVNMMSIPLGASNGRIH